MNNDMKQCENQVMLFFRHLDNSQYDAMLALLAPDAVWYRQGRKLEGPSEIQAALMQRSTTMVITHIITNLAFKKLETDHCDISAYMLVVRHEPGAEMSGPAPLDGIESIRDLHIKMKRNVDQWLITELNGEATIFKTIT